MKRLELVLERSFVWKREKTVYRVNAGKENVEILFARETEQKNQKQRAWFDVSRARIKR